MATDSQDRVYLAVRTTQAIDDNTGVVLVLDRDGRYVRSIGGDRLRTPHHIWVSPDDEVYVTDCFDHAVRVYTTTGEQVQVIGTPGQPGMPGGPFNQPTCAVRSAHSGDVFVSDGYRQNRVHRFSGDGELRLSWGSGDRNQYDWEVFEVGEPSTGPGEYNTPHSVTVGADNRVYVMDRSNHRIQTLDENGKYLSEWPVPHPDKAVIDDGVLHVGTWEGVAVFTLDGDPIGKWGQGGHMLCIDPRGDVYTTFVGPARKFARV